MYEPRCRVRFPFEASQPIGICREIGPEHPESDIPLPVVARVIQLAEPRHITR